MPFPLPENPMSAFCLFSHFLGLNRKSTSQGNITESLY